jgi:hypothetical protein
MMIKGTALRKSLLLATVSLGLLSMSCTRMPTPEELAILDAQIEAADAAEAKRDALIQEKANLEAELARQKKILADHEAEFSEIKTRMEAK